jgi:hypothetical protein
MTIKKLRDLLALLGAGHDGREIKVWLPGTTISLSDSIVFSSKHGIIVEGNVDPGSALSEDT